MTLIEGIGDEVVQFAGVVVVFIVGALAWWSTNANPDRYRTVLVMRSRPHHPVTVSIRTRSNMVLTSTQSSSTTVSTAASTSSASIPSPPSTTEEAPQEGARVIPLQEMDSIVDADMAMLDNNRLHFYRRMDSPNNSQVSTVESPEPAAEAEPASTAQMREMDSIVSAMEADVTTGCDFFTRPSESSSHNATVSKKKLKVKKGSLEINQKSEDNETASAEPEVSNVEEMAAGDQTDNNVDETSKILIKLKYLNDTLKEVEGSLDELLKDFKRRHFSLELSAESVVRLIFHGRVLDEASTLRACGLHHRAVVHALVHPRRAGQTHGTPEEAPLSPTHELVTEGAPPERAWDLENILMTLVSVALTVVWFFSCVKFGLYLTPERIASAWMI